MPRPEPLQQELTAFAARPEILVGVDFDGTLAPIVDDPRDARPAAGGMESLRELAALPGVTAAVVSGRDLETLRRLTGLGCVPDPEADGSIVLIGSHGGQSSLDVQSGSPLLDDAARQRLAVLSSEAEEIVRTHAPSRIEHKPAAVAVHTRGVDPQAAGAALAATRELATRHTGVHVLPGKDVVELSVLETSKGLALAALAEARQVDATAYVGDDVTDERAFEVLGERDLTVKVGPGDTVARHRVPDIDAVIALLQELARLRR